jgi:transposase
VPRRYQSGEVDYTGSISKCGDRRMRTLLYEAANVILTRYKQPLKLKDWALAIAQTVHPPEGADRARPAARHHHARHAPARHGV